MKNSCDVLEEAIDRYKQILSNEARLAKRYSVENATTAAKKDGELSTLRIYLENSCERYPRLSSNESCRFCMFIEARWLLERMEN